MTDTQLKIQKTSRFACLALNVLKILLILGLVLLVFASILYADAYSRSQVEAMALTTHVMEAIMSVVPSAQNMQPVFFLCLILQMVYQLILVLILGQLARVFRGISRSGTPFSEDHIQPIRRAFKLALAMFLVDMVKGGFLSAMEAGVVGFRFELSLNWLAALALVECLLSIFDYGCQLQRESDETL